MCLESELKTNLLNIETLVADRMSDKLKAIIQQYHATLIDDKIKI